jgi:hypothetical protein
MRVLQSVKKKHFKATLNADVALQLRPSSFMDIMTLHDGLGEVQQPPTSSILPRSAVKLLRTSPQITARGGFISKDHSQVWKVPHHSVNSQFDHNSDFPDPSRLNGKRRSSKMTSRPVTNSANTDSAWEAHDEAEFQHPVRRRPGVRGTSSITAQDSFNSGRSIASTHAVLPDSESGSPVKAPSHSAQRSCSGHRRQQDHCTPPGLKTSNEFSGDRIEEELSQMSLDKAVLSCSSTEDLMWLLRTALLDGSHEPGSSDSATPAALHCSQSAVNSGTCPTGTSISAEQVESAVSRLRYLQRGLPIESSLKYKRVAEAVCSFLAASWMSQQQQQQLDNGDPVGVAEIKAEVSTQAGASDNAPFLSLAHRAMHLLQDTASLGPLFYSRWGITLVLMHLHISMPTHHESL